MLTLSETILAQYANSPIIMALLTNFNESIDPRVNINDFCAKMWDVATAEGYGLDVWGRIVGVTRYLRLPHAGVLYLGFAEAGGDAQPFDQGPFWNGVPVTDNHALEDEEFRLLIMVKAMTNISDCSAKSTNAALTALFGDSGKCYVVDNGDMSIEYHFEFVLTAIQSAIIEQSGAVLRPAGVSVTVVSA